MSIARGALLAALGAALAFPPADRAGPPAPALTAGADAGGDHRYLGRYWQLRTRRRRHDRQ